MKVFYNGKVYVGGGEYCSAFAVEDGRFVSTGTDEQMLSLAENAEKTDLCGRFVCAGFNDSHMHLLNYAQFLRSADLSKHTSSLKCMIDAMREHYQKTPHVHGAWLCGRGWNQDYFTDTKRMPSRWDLDEITADIPIIITRACGHCCVVNSKALELCLITADTVSPDGGVIGKTDGEVDGRLYDNAMDIVFSNMKSPSKEEIKSMITDAQKALNSYGITSVQSDDYCVFRSVPFEVINDAYKELEADGKLTVRVYEQCNFTELDELKRFILLGNKSGVGSDMFKIGPLKLLGDGSLGSRTAHVTFPYIGTTDEKGFSLFTKEQLNSLVSYAHKNGMQIAVHAIGDACLDNVLDAFEDALNAHPRIDHRHGIVHCQITRRDQLERMCRLKMHIYAQSVFLDYDNHIIDKLVPKQIAETSYNWKTLLDGGCTVSNGSDCPVEAPDVMKGIECAITRTSLDGTCTYLKDQAFSVDEALSSFTRFGAVASFEEERKGSIEQGMLADFAVLESDPFSAAPQSIHKIGIHSTYLGGKLVYSN